MTKPEGDCPCLSPDPTVAHATLKGAISDALLVDDSHLIISIRSCRNCQRRYLVVFYELIDWTDGDDSQARVFMPITPEAEAQMLSLGPDLDEQALMGMNLSGDQLVWSWPRGGEPYLSRLNGPLAMFPHD